MPLQQLVDAKQRPEFRTDSAIVEAISLFNKFRQDLETNIDRLPQRRYTENAHEKFVRIRQALIDSPNQSDPQLRPVMACIIEAYDDLIDGRIHWTSKNRNVRIMSQLCLDDNHAEDEEKAKELVENNLMALCKLIDSLEAYNEYKVEPAEARGLAETIERGEKALINANEVHDRTRYTVLEKSKSKADGSEGEQLATQMSKDTVVLAEDNSFLSDKGSCNPSDISFASINNAASLRRSLQAAGTTGSTINLTEEAKSVVVEELRNIVTVLTKRPQRGTRGHQGAKLTNKASDAQKVKDAKLKKVPEAAIARQARAQTGTSVARKTGKQLARRRREAPASSLYDRQSTRPGTTAQDTFAFGRSASTGPTSSQPRCADVVTELPSAPGLSRPAIQQPERDYTATFSEHDFLPPAMLGNISFDNPTIGDSASTGSLNTSQQDMQVLDQPYRQHLHTNLSTLHPPPLTRNPFEQQPMIYSPEYHFVTTFPQPEVVRPSSALEMTEFSFELDLNDRSLDPRFPWLDSTVMTAPVNCFESPVRTPSALGLTQHTMPASTQGDAHSTISLPSAPPQAPPTSFDSMSEETTENQQWQAGPFPRF